MERYVLIKMKNKDFSKVVDEIYLVTGYNHEQYSEYYYSYKKIR